MSVILVTGSSTGIGQETALHMARKGHQVYAGVRSPETADELRDKIAAESLPVNIVKLDLVDPDTMQPQAVLDRPLLLMAAVRLGSIRLLDNRWLAPPAGVTA